MLTSQEILLAFAILPANGSIRVLIRYMALVTCTDYKRLPGSGFRANSTLAMVVLDSVGERKSQVRKATNDGEYSVVITADR